MIRWPWKRRGATRPDPDAVAAVRSAEVRHAAARGRREVAAPVIARLNEAYRRNHLAEGILNAMRTGSDRP